MIVLNGWDSWLGALVENGSTAGDVGLLFCLLILGLALIICEVFFVSMGILGGAAAVCLVTAVFLGFGVNTFWGFTMLAGSAVGAPLAIHYAFRWLPHTSFGKKMYLSGPNPEDVTGSGEDPTIQALMGQHGMTASDLRPSGFATISGRRIDVVTRGEMVPKDTAVKVIEVEGNRVVVAQDNSAG